MTLSSPRRHARRLLAAVSAGAVALSISAVVPGGAPVSAATLWGPSIEVSAPATTATWVQMATTPAGDQTLVVFGVRDGNDVRIDSRVADIEGRTATWGTTTNVVNGGSNYPQGLAVSADGSTAIMLVQRSVAGLPGPNQYYTVASIADGTVTWGPLELAGSGNVGSVALSDDGSVATIVWQDGTSTQSMTGTLDGTTATFDPAVTIMPATPDTFNARLAVSADGSTAVAWRSGGYPGPTYGYYQEMVVGTLNDGSMTWGTPSKILGDDVRTNGGAQVAVSDDGSTIAIALTRASGWPYEVVAKTGRNVAGSVTWGDFAVLAETTSEPSIDMSADGTRVVVATQVDNAVMTTVGSVSGTDATWSSATRVSAAGGQVSEPKIEMSADGSRAHLHWTGVLDRKQVLHASAGQLSASSQSWDAPTAYGKSGEQTVIPFVVEMSDDGSLVVSAWAAQIGQYPNTTELVRVRAAEVRYPPTAPGIGVTRGDTKVTVRIEPPESDGGSPITGYQARCTAGSKSFTTSPSTNLKQVVKKLRNGVSYDCSARARNAAGWSAWSKERSVTPSTRPAVAPSAPELRRVSVRGREVTVVVEHPEVSGGSTIDRYQARCVNGSEVVTSRSSASKIHSFTTLTPDVEWTCSGRAGSVVGWSTWSATQAVTPRPPS